jgi:hypothetical protein
MATSYTDLKIFRGTYAQIVALSPDNMTFYLATDTNQLFVGGPGTNQLIEYSGNIGENRDSLLQLRDDLTTGLNNALISIGALGEADAGILNTINNTNDGIIKRINDLETSISDLDQTVTNKITELAPTVLTELYATKDELEAEVVGIQTFVGANFYSKNQVDVAIDNRISSENNGLVSKDLFDNTILGLDLYKSVELASPTAVDFNALINFLAGKADGVYKVEIEMNQPETVHELVLKNGANIIRFAPNGVAYYRDGSSWKEVLGTKVNNVNGITTEDGIITIDADDIPDTELNKWNSLVPDSDGVVNAGGRDQDILSKPIGNNSVAIGYLSSGQAFKSVAVGYAANAIGENSIQLGEGSVGTNNTFQVGEHPVMNIETGLILSERLPFINEELTLSPGESWTTVSGSDFLREQTVSLVGISSSSLLWVSPSEETYSEFVDYEVRASAQGTNSVTFRCIGVPSVAIKVNLIARL